MLIEVFKILKKLSETLKSLWIDNNWINDSLDYHFVNMYSELNLDSLIIFVNQLHDGGNNTKIKMKGKSLKSNGIIVYMKPISYI